jgi:RHS repeat-associated protein
VSTNPNGSVTTHADRFGRTTLVERSEGHNTAYTYGNDGLLQSMISSNGADRVYTYDAYDRVATATDSVACFVGTRWIRKTFTYGAGSVVSSIKYTSPDGDITTETYTYANGHNTGITLPDNTKVWSLVSENDLGVPTQIQSGQVTREYGYTATGLPTYRKMGNPFNGGLGALQHVTYQFNPQTGNLMSRTDVRHSQTETFTYDALDRLSSINGRTITYDNAKGNITAIGGVGTMTYGNSLHPYRITGMTPVADSLISFGTQRITYTSFDRPATIKEGIDSVTFRYGCDSKRVSMNGIVTNGIFVSSYATDYIGDRYECKWDDSIEPIREILYLGGDAYSAPMVYVKLGNGNWTLYNIGRDYLGNITLIATKNGLPFAEYSYDPWGRLRNPQTLAIYDDDNAPSLFLGRGFTGHEHLPWFGLINMNARLYDPLLGRFLAPDPFVQDPDFTQNFNRYSYALNNPLKYSDESGEFVLSTMLIVGGITAAIFGAGNLAAHAIRQDDLGHGEWAKYFFSGAIAGLAVGSLGYLGISGLTALSGMSGFLGTAGKITLAGAKIVAGAQAASTVASVIGGAINSGWNGVANAGKIMLGNFYLDENKSFLGQVWEGISRHTWEAPQQAAGYIWSGIRNCWADRVDYMVGATFITEENSNKGGISLGGFINYDYYDVISGNFDTFVTKTPGYMHEYGHSIDSKRKGLSYIFTIGFPSIRSAANAAAEISPEGFLRSTHRSFRTETSANNNAADYFGSFYGVSWSSDRWINPIGRLQIFIDAYPL